jgi:hypothetical protein
VAHFGWIVNNLLDGKIRNIGIDFSVELICSCAVLSRMCFHFMCVSEITICTNQFIIVQNSSTLKAMRIVFSQGLTLESPMLEVALRYLPCFVKTVLSRECIMTD